MTAPDARERIRVLVADDDFSMRAALGDLIADERCLELVATATNGEDAIALATRLKPDVALLDIRMPGGGGVQAARRMREVSARTAVLALSASGDRDSVVGMVEAGAVGYLVKGCSAEEVIDGIRVAAQRRSALSAEAAAHVVGALSRQLQLESELATGHRERLERIDRVVAGQGLRMVFQPMWDFASGRPFAYEALARFAGPPERSPDQWFSEAAETGQLLDLELQAVETAVHAFADREPDASLSLNVSPDSIASPRLFAALERVPLDRIILELTEHIAISDYEAAVEHVQRLRARGARLAVDDAGAGFASLKHVLRLAPDFIKLDMALTREVERDRTVRALTSALVGFAGETGATIIAEGIETHTQLEALRNLGITCGQGYLLGRPGDLPVTAGSTTASPVASVGVP